jgi:hypothetical protein
VFRWKDDLQHFAIIRPSKNGMANAGWLNPARTFLHGVDAMPLKLALEPALEDIHELKLNVVMMPLAQLPSEGCDHADHMRGRQSTGRRRDAEIPVCRVAGKSSGFKIGLIQVADGKFLALVESGIIHR